VAVPSPQDGVDPVPPVKEIALGRSAESCLRQSFAISVGNAITHQQHTAALLQALSNRALARISRRSQ